MNPDELDEELRDVVFDYEGSKALLYAAEDFLDGKPTYNGPDARSSYGESNVSGMTDNSIIRRNRLEQGRHDPTKIKLLQDRLDEKGKARLAQLLLEIDENMDDLMKEKAEYAKQGMRSTKGGFAGAGQFDTKS